MYLKRPLCQEEPGCPRFFLEKAPTNVFLSALTIQNCNHFALELVMPNAASVFISGTFTGKTKKEAHLTLKKLCSNFQATHSFKEL
jgi:hypothetical protein